MHYENMTTGVFRSRPNRFIANIEIDGVLSKVHVKNTGRCRELLIPGTPVYVQKASNTDRKTAYDLIAVRRGDQIVNMDSQAPNKVAEELLRSGTLIGSVADYKTEQTYGDSRFDLYAETDDGKWFIEVKGVTLEIDGGAYFPDAPTERGIKHMKELIRCRREGYRAMLLFIIQMKGVHFLKGNVRTHPAFAETMRMAHEAGVEIAAYDCIAGEDTLFADQRIPVLYD